MLEFFRKYQRILFIITAVAIIISFSFFGVQNLLTLPQQVKDRPVGKLIDGSTLMSSHLEQMVRFISSDRDDFAAMEKGSMPNLFNDGVISRDLLQSGRGMLLARAYFEELKGALGDKLDSHKRFRPYVHQSLPFISAERVWKELMPEKEALLARFLKEKQELSPETLSLLIDLYLAQRELPPHLLRNYLLMQEKQLSWVEADPALRRKSLALFNAATASEWFGAPFVRLSAYFILNGAAYAEQQGLIVTDEETRISLMRNGYEAFQRERRGELYSEEEFARLWQQQQRLLGMTEKEMVATWKRVLLCRRLFEEAGGGVVVDPLPYATLHAFADRRIEIERYTLPKALQIKDFEALMQLELYLKRVAPPHKGLLLPTHFLSVEEVAAHSPDLVESRFLLHVASVSKRDLAHNVSLKEMWEWQLQREHYVRLEKEFPELALKKGEDCNSYFVALEGLEPKLRQKVDYFSREQIVEGHPEWIASALEAAPTELREIAISSSGKNSLFSGFPEQGLRLSALLITSPLGEEEESALPLSRLNQELDCFSPDGETYYRFELVDRDNAKRVLTFGEAYERGILASLLDEQLQEAYSTIRERDPAPFRSGEGEWLPFYEVREKVGRHLHAKLLAQLEAEARRLHFPLSSSSGVEKIRLLPFMERAAADIQKRGEASHFLGAPSSKREEGRLSPQLALTDQWALTCERLELKESERAYYLSFTEGASEWSGLALDSSGFLTFFEVKREFIPERRFDKEVCAGQMLLAEEAASHRMQELLSALKAADSIHLEEPYDSALEGA